MNTNLVKIREYPQKNFPNLWKPNKGYIGMVLTYQGPSSEEVVLNLISTVTTILNEDSNLNGYDNIQLRHLFTEQAQNWSAHTTKETYNNSSTNGGIRVGKTNNNYFIETIGPASKKHLHTLIKAAKRINQELKSKKAIEELELETWFKEGALIASNQELTQRDGTGFLEIVSRSTKSVTIEYQDTGLDTVNLKVASTYASSLKNANMG